MCLDQLPLDWQQALNSEFEAAYFLKLQQFVTEERQKFQVFPAEDDVFNALKLTPLNQVRVLILGQDPYHDQGQAHGLSFSVRPEFRLPPSLRNIFRELQDDLGTAVPEHGCLEAWAKQGVLLLNTVLTVRAHEAFSHRKQGWEQFTSRVIEQVNQRPNVAFVLWGKPAQATINLIDDRHLVVTSAHPSPLSARRGFFGSRPFSRINAYLLKNGSPPIDW